MKKWLGLLAIGFVLSAASLPAFANGRPPQDLVSEDSGYACSTPKKGSGVIAGYFRGWEQTPFQNRGAGMMPVERYRCFNTIKECHAWLRTMTYWYNKKTIDTSLCSPF